VDVEKLRQVLINLIENARDAVAGNDDGRHIEVALRAAHGRAHLRVADDGPGIPTDVLGSVFEPFFSRKPQGTGFGLAIVKRTVEAHAGRVTASAAPDGGAVFEIDLPLERNA
jgi:signal transduction histidine kinase